MELCVTCPPPSRKLVCRLHSTILLLATVRACVGIEVKSPATTAPIVNTNDHSLMRTEVLTTTQMVTATSAQSFTTKQTGQVHAQMLHSGAMHIIHDKHDLQHTKKHAQPVHTHIKNTPKQSKDTTSKPEPLSSSKNVNHGNLKTHNSNEGMRVGEHSAPKLSKGTTPRQELLSSSKNSKQGSLKAHNGNEGMRAREHSAPNLSKGTTPRPELLSPKRTHNIKDSRSKSHEDGKRAHEIITPKRSSTTPRPKLLSSKRTSNIKDSGLDKHKDGMRTHEQVAPKRSSSTPKPERVSSKQTKSSTDGGLDKHEDGMQIHEHFAPKIGSTTARPELLSSKRDKSMDADRLRETHNDSVQVHEQSAPKWSMGATSRPEFVSSNQTFNAKDTSLEKEGNHQDVRDGFQERFDDDWSEQQRGYTWKQEHASRDEANDDDWDDEREHKDVIAGDGDGDDDSDSSDGDGDGDDGYGDANNLQPEVDVTGEKDVTIAPDTGPLKAVTPHQPKPQVPENNVERLGEGIGAMAYERSPTGSRSINHEIRERLEFQDCAAFAILLSVFVLTVLLSCFSVYQVADDPSPVAYYSEPKNYRQQRVMCETADADSFLAAFNTQPEDVRIRIIGKNPEPGGFRRFLRTLHPHTMRPRGLSALLPVRQRRLLPVLFDVSLDLTAFITGSGRVSDENLEILQTYLNTKNRLETLLLQKRVDWTHFKDVATNVRQQLRTLGFPGEVDVRFEAYDEVLVYQNHKWTNFVRNRVTQALVVISVVGSFFWLPYVWTRTKKTKIESRFQVNVDPGRFWQLVSEGLSAAEGFQAT